MHRIRDFLHEKLFWCTESVIFCTKSFFTRKKNAIAEGVAMASGLYERDFLFFQLEGDFDAGDFVREKTIGLYSVLHLRATVKHGGMIAAAH